ncbi:TnsD family Tn7-like transposition protein [Lysinibacillus sp. NPDC047702]|uniref:TnsD family Tn7-like transposition protein n=1 Tax=unclassified Lysinibacillus TaxID=2636778 RepID=UPI003CFEDB42
MLPFFTNPYPDELLYSAIARYHFYSGNLDCKDTLEELFGSRSVIPSVEIGSYFSVLAERLGPQYSVESLLANHTIYPYYASFLSKERQQEILQDVLLDGQALYTRLGIVAGGICRKDGLYYCAECAKSDNVQYGEPYIHREHQLQGINYCPHHEILLRQYPIKSDSRIQYISFEMKHMNLTTIYDADPYKEIAVAIAKQAYQLLQLTLHELSREVVSSKYRGLLRERNLITASNRVRQKELYQAVQSHFPKFFLQLYESELNEADEYNWLKVLLRNSKRHVHPLRHLFFLHFLQQDINSFKTSSTDQGAFGADPLPCLNKAASHYKQFIIQDVNVTRDFKTKNMIGTFTCSCGFIYVRKHTTPILKIGRIKAFGVVWLQKLNELAIEKLSIRAMARELGVDSKTIKRYLNGNVELKQYEDSGAVEVKLAQYKQELLDGMKLFSHLSQTKLREKFKKQYIYLYRNDKSWLEENLPPKQHKQKPTKSVDWLKRDQQYAKQIKALYHQLLKEKKSVRITTSIIGKRLGNLANIERHLDKLPQTSKLLQEITESVQDFQLRRCYKIIDELLENNEPILLWQVQRVAAIKSNHFHEIKPILESYIAMKRDVTKDERTTS